MHVRRRMGLENRFVVGTVGRMGYAKNHRFLVDCFYEIQKRTENANHIRRSGSARQLCDGDILLHSAVLHQSTYPFPIPNVFVCGGRLYMCPETRQNDEIAVYELKAFPDQWEKRKVLLSNVQCVDTTFCHDQGHPTPFRIGQQRKFLFAL